MLFRSLLTEQAHHNAQGQDSRTSDKTSGRQKQIANELERIRKSVNHRLGSASRLNAVFEQKHPFVKTATHKIKRYLYTAESLRQEAG